LSDLKISLRTFYRELDLLSRCGVKVRYQHRLYQLLRTGPEPAEGRLPFPDPQLTFAEMAELAVCPCPAAQRLSDLLEAVIKPAEPKKRQSARSGKRKT
jgi:predicted DNA-binding transcriptional regulator YafY